MPERKNKKRRPHVRVTQIGGGYQSQQRKTVKKKLAHFRPWKVGHFTRIERSRLLLSSRNPALVSSDTLKLAEVHPNVPTYEGQEVDPSSTARALFYKRALHPKHSGCCESKKDSSRTKTRRCQLPNLHVKPCPRVPPTQTSEVPFNAVWGFWQLRPRCRHDGTTVQAVVLQHSHGSNPFTRLIPLYESLLLVPAIGIDTPEKTADIE